MNKKTGTMKRIKALIPVLLLLLTAFGCGSREGRQTADIIIKTQTEGEETGETEEGINLTETPAERKTSEVPETESEILSDTEAPARTETEAPAETETLIETETETETQAPFQTEETKETESEQEARVGKEIFFGHYVDAGIAALNTRTLQAEGSCLYDVLSEPLFTAESVRTMIGTYAFPETAYLGTEERTDDAVRRIAENRNLGGLTEESFSVRYALLTENADVRGFPSMLPAKNELTNESFDLLQESMFSIGEGVLVLHESSDGLFLFVQGSNYFGWIERRKAAFCSRPEFHSYLSSEYFLVVLKMRHMMGTYNLRLGTVIPYTEKSGTGYTVLLPGADHDGNLQLRTEYLSADPEALSEGFLPYSAEDLAARSFGLTGFPYGWGDTNEYYDCSSTAGLLYQCYGIRLPRNTSRMKSYDGGGEFAVSVEGLSDEEKLAVLSGHPGAVLVMKGHAMIYGGIRKDADGSEHYIVVHANSGFYDSPTADVFHEVYAVAEADLLGLYRANGERFLSAVHTILYFE